MEIFYIANGGHGDLFDYIGYNTEKKTIEKAWVDWDSGRGNEMLPKWADNSILTMPEVYLNDLREVMSKWFLNLETNPIDLIKEFDGILNIPVKVSTGRKFKGDGTLVNITKKIYIDVYNREKITYTAHILDNDGNIQSAVAERCEVEEKDIFPFIQKGFDMMSIKEIQNVAYDCLWKFGSMKSKAIMAIFRKACPNYAINIEQSLSNINPDDATNKQMSFIKKLCIKTAHDYLWEKFKSKENMTKKQASLIIDYLNSLKDYLFSSVGGNEDGYILGEEEKELLEKLELS